MMKPRKSGGKSVGKGRTQNPKRGTKNAKPGRPGTRATRGPGEGTRSRKEEGSTRRRDEERSERRTSPPPYRGEAGRGAEESRGWRVFGGQSDNVDSGHPERSRRATGRHRDEDSRGRKGDGNDRPRRKPVSYDEERSERRTSPPTHSGEAGRDAERGSRNDDFRKRETIKGPQKKTVRFDDEDRPHRKRLETESKTKGRRDEDRPRRKPASYHEDSSERRTSPPPFRREAGRAAKRPSRPSKKGDNPGEIRLNKYIADAGICSRREADDLIVSGAVKVNGEIITVLGTKVFATDKVQIGDQTLSREAFRYVLLNKPKGYITTVEDPEGRKTVMFLIRDACKERIYPVGRLDRNTTGVLLFTNDGELAKKLTHPKYGIRKMYHVVLDQPLTHEHMKNIEEGLELEDGFVKVDAIAYVGDGKDRRQLGVEIHSGKNRIVRRIFEELGYTINTLDRVIFAGLTKKDLPRGRWRHLTADELNYLKMQG